MISSVGLSLIALASGMFLLAKTNKDNLGKFFKIIACFIIIASILNLVCAGLHNAMKFYRMRYYKHEMMNEKFMNHDGMGFHHGWGKDGYEGSYGRCYNYESNCGGVCSEGKVGNEKKDSCCNKRMIEKKEK